MIFSKKTNLWGDSSLLLLTRFLTWLSKDDISVFISFFPESNQLHDTEIRICLNCATDMKLLNNKLLKSAAKRYFLDKLLPVQYWGITELQDIPAALYAAINGSPGHEGWNATSCFINEYPPTPGKNVRALYLFWTRKHLTLNRELCIFMWKMKLILVLEEISSNFRDSDKGI